MTNQSATVENYVQTVYGKDPIIIGLLKSPNDSPFIGGRQVRRSLGEDTDPQFMDALFNALARHESLESQTRAARLQAEDGQRRWLISVEQVLNQPPGLQPADSRFGAVTTFLRHLLPGTVPALPIGYVIQAEGQPDSSIFPIEPWRYATLAGILWRHLSPNLRTREMHDPNAVWRRLRELFKQYQIIRGHWPSMLPGQRKRDMASFYLAVYEQTLQLLHDRQRDAPAYRTAIRLRQPSNGIEAELDPTLAIPNGWPAYQLTDLQRIRVEAFDDLLMATLANCHASLSCLR